MRYLVLILALAIQLAMVEPLLAKKSKFIESFFVEGNYVDGTKAMQKRLDLRGQDPEAAYAKGIMEFLQAFERFSGSLHRYGLRSQQRISILRIPVGNNPNPQQITYQKFRLILQEFIDDLDRVEKTLSQHPKHGELELPVWKIRVDLNGDGDASDQETFSVLFFSLFNGAMPPNPLQLTPERAKFYIGFDQADVHWLIAYTHSLRSVLEVYMAYDTEEFFNTYAFRLFEGVPIPPQAAAAQHLQAFGWIADLVLAAHRAHFKLVEPNRMAAAREHMLSMIKHSRLMWQSAENETDDNNEWIPNAKQTQVTMLNVTTERITAWFQILDVAEEVLEGKKLISHWRATSGVGVNINRVFTQPEDFDLVEWIHGEGALPFLEAGPIVDQATQTQILNAFDGRLLEFSLRVN